MVPFAAREDFPLLNHLQHFGGEEGGGVVGDAYNNEFNHNYQLLTVNYQLTNRVRVSVVRHRRK